jgi:hypothetical protein
LPSSIRIKIRRTVKWLKSAFFASLKIQPQTPSQYLKSHTLKFEGGDEDEAELAAGTELSMAISPIYRTLFKDLAVITEKVNQKGAIHHTTGLVRAFVTSPSGRKLEDLTMFDVLPRSPTEFGFIDCHDLMQQFLSYQGKTDAQLWLDLEFEFELLTTPTFALGMATLTPTQPIQGRATTPSSSLHTRLLESQATGRAGGATPPPSGRKTTTNTMLTELKSREEAAAEQQRRDGLPQPRLVFTELDCMWRCKEERRCKNYRNGETFTWCFTHPGEKSHCQLSSHDLNKWALAIRASRATLTNPPVDIHRQRQATTKKEEMARQSTDLDGNPQCNLVGRVPKSARQGGMTMPNIVINNSAQATPWAGVPGNPPFYPPYQPPYQPS